MGPPAAAAAAGRSSSSSSSKKRIRAKVGKRAPNRVNVTDTSFRAVSLHVRSQHVDETETENNNANENAAASTTKATVAAAAAAAANAKLLSCWTTALHHPASAVRKSAAKNLLDWIVVNVESSNTSNTSSNSSSGIVGANKTTKSAAAAGAGVWMVVHFLSVLIPAIGKCLVDEDCDKNETQTLALRMLQHILQALHLQQQQQQQQQQQHLRQSLLLRPFVPLLTAFVSSALNSLDGTTRWHGAVALQLLCHFRCLASTTTVTASTTPPRNAVLIAQQTTSTAYSDFASVQLATFVPALCRLLTDSLRHGSGCMGSASAVLEWSNKWSNNGQSFGTAAMATATKSIKGGNGDNDDNDDGKNILSSTSSTTKQQPPSSSARRNKRSRSSTTTSSQQQQQPAAVTSQMVVLQSLVSLLECTATTNSSSSNSSSSASPDEYENEYDYAKDDDDPAASNHAAWISGRRQRRRGLHSFGIHQQLLLLQRHLGSFSNEGGAVAAGECDSPNNSSSNHSNKRMRRTETTTNSILLSSSSPLAMICELLALLRDVWIEITTTTTTTVTVGMTRGTRKQQQQQSLPSSLSRDASVVSTTVCLIAKALRLVYARWIVALVAAAQGNEQDDFLVRGAGSSSSSNNDRNLQILPELERITLQWQKLIVELFPWKSNSNGRGGGSVDRVSATTHAINGELSKALVFMQHVTNLVRQVRGRVQLPEQLTNSSHKTNNNNNKSRSICWGHRANVTANSNATAALEAVMTHVEQCLESFRRRQPPQKGNTSSFGDDNNNNYYDNFMEQCDEASMHYVVDVLRLLLLLFLPHSERLGTMHDDPDTKASTSRSSDDENGQQLLNHANQHRLVQLFCSTFFSRTEESDDDNENYKATMIPAATASRRGMMARQAVGLLHQLWARYDYDMALVQQHWGKTVIHAIASLPLYLVLWKGHFLSSSRIAIHLLHNVVRRIPNSNNDDNAEREEFQPEMLVKLRIGMESIVIETRDNHDEDEEDDKPIDSLLEKYPPSLQRHCVGLIVMLESPTAGTVKGLSQICARSVATAASSSSSSSPEIASYIVHAVHTIRRTILMQTFLSFLVDSTGIMNIDSTDSGRSGGDPIRNRVRLNVLLAYDAALRQVCNCLVDCEPAKVLPRLHRLLCHLLLPSNVNNNEEISATDASCPEKKLLQMRAALSIVAIMALAIQETSVEPRALTVFDLLPNDPDFKRKILESICTFIIQYSSFLESDVDSDLVGRWIAPIITLFSIEYALFQQTFELLVPTLQGEDEMTKSKMMDLLLIIVKHEHLALLIQDFNNEFLRLGKSVQACMVNGPLERKAEMLLACIEARQ